MSPLRVSLLREEDAIGVDMARGDRGFTITFDWQRALIPLSLLVLVVLRFALHAPLWLLTALCLWIPVYYVGVPVLINHRWRRFEKEFTIRFQRGDYRGLLEYYRAQWLLRRFGPRAEMLAKLGLIYFALERYREAEHALERAIDASQLGSFREQLFYNLANVKFELGKYEDAEQIYRSLRGGSPYRQSAQTQLALIDLHRGQRVEQALQVLRSERHRASGMLRDRIDEALAQQ